MRNALDDLARVMLLWFTLKGAYDLSVLACDAARRQVRAARRARRIAKKLRAKNAVRRISCGPYRVLPY